MVSATYAQTLSKFEFFQIDPKATAQHRNAAPIDRALMYKLDKNFTRSSRSNKEHMNLVVPTFEGSKSLILKKVKILSDNFRVTTETGDVFTEGENYVFYQGYIEGNEAKSIAAVSMRGEEIDVLISDQTGDFQINRFDKTHYVGFYNNELKEQQEFICSTNGIKENQNVVPKVGTNRAPSSDCVDIYFEVDYSAYSKKGKNLSATTDWVVNLFNQVSLQYNRVGISIKISEIMIHTSSDPYVGFSGSENVLYEFKRVRSISGFNGRLAHLLSGRSLGGGVAWLNALCSTYNNYAVSGNLNGGVVAYPNYSWNVMVIAHEMGHNFGSPHTQDCSWNGNYTAIDGCVTTPGSCGQPPVPEDGGTIMSYCHLNAVGVNLSKGFGPQPGELIYNKFINADCILSQDCSDVPPINDECLTAIELFPSISCIEWTYDNVYSTATSNLGAFSCDATANPKDVWFKVTIPTSGKVNIETSTINGGLDDLVIETYTGDCFGLTLWECDDNSGAGNQALLNIDDISKAGQEIYIRVADVGSNDSGEFSICAYTEETPCNYALTDSLLSFYNATNGDSWTNKQGWEDGLNSGDCDYCQWYGIICNNKAEIIGINLSNNNLSGYLYSSIDTFFKLQTINLSNNSISGGLPTEIENLTSLQTLDISHNNFNDTLPDALRNMRGLKHLDVSNNQFYGTTPLYFGFYLSNLNYLDFSSNNLSGCFDSSLSNYCSINFFSMSGNPLMPYSGDVSLMCSDGFGVDSDGDSHCANVTDCNDNEADSFDGNPEICDGIDNDCNGIVDDGYLGLQNVYLGLSTDWMDENNWSLGHIPLPCEEVMIGMDESIREVIIPPNTYGIIVKGIKVGSNGTFTVGVNASLELSSTGVIVNHGTLNAYGYIYCNKTDKSIPYAIRNYGDIYIVDGGFSFNNQTGSVIINELGGYIQNKGDLSMYMHEPDPNLNAGIVNYGIIENHRGINIYGEFQIGPLVLKANSTFTTKATGQYDRINISN
ncbi:hypothetical protein GCM10007940_05830 [Portibacter lacus]|uniref:Peptidase M12B domain-containing protein n=2 Tax=Portibacter lacus TaxID=1099794 RepID=A0AA37SK25_9BACT|nr:hypothetical protein GCM10007940_05830 [Portibacter lacus]